MLRKIKNYFIAEFYPFNWKENLYSLVWALVVATLFRSLLFEPFKIPSGSMIPTLQVGDRLFVKSYSYGYSRWSFPWGFAPISGRIFFKSPNRGDIIVFKGVKDPQTFYIKRLVGLPGDTVQVSNGNLYINNQRIEKEKIREFSEINLLGEPFEYLEFKEQLDNGVSYYTLSRKDSRKNLINFDPDNTIEYKIPDKHYFFMGDNRNNSVDSRFLDRNIGYVPEENLIGKASFLFWTADFSVIDFFTKFETGRAFKAIEP